MFEVVKNCLNQFLRLYLRVRKVEETKGTRPTVYPTEVQLLPKDGPVGDITLICPQRPSPKLRGLCFAEEGNEQVVRVLTSKHERAIVKVDEWLGLNLHLTKGPQSGNKEEERASSTVS